MKNMRILIILIVISIFLPSALMSEVRKDNAPLADCGKRLEEALEARAQKEAEYQEALSSLKKLLLKAFMRLGAEFAVVLVDATTDLQMAIKKLKDSVADDAAAIKAGRAQGEMLAEWERLIRKATDRRAKVQARQIVIDQLDELIAALETRDMFGRGPRRPSEPFDLSVVGEDDLLYGLYQRPGSSGNPVAELQRRIGRGKLLGDVEGERIPRINPITKQQELVSEWSRRNLTDAANKGNKIIFDLTGIRDMENVLRNQLDPERRVFITGRELRHIRNNWGGTFNENNVIFIIQRDGEILRIPPPWE